MTSLLILIPFALILVCFAVVTYLWAINHDQYTDLDREASRILFEEQSDADQED